MDSIALLKEATAEWLAISDLAKTTRLQYQWHLLDGELSLVRWLERDPLTQVKGLTRDRLAFWRKALLDRYAATTTHQAVTAARGLLRWMEAEHLQVGRFPLAWPLTDVLKRPPIRITPHKTVMPEEYEALLATMTDSNPKSIRDSAMLTMLYETGMRSVEFLSLSLEDVKFNGGHGWVQIRARKGGDVGESVFGVLCCERLQNWLAIRRSLTTALWVGVRRPFDGTPICREGLRTIIQKWCAQAGIRRLSPHDFRRGSAMMHLKHNTNREWVMRQFGWKDERMYRVYTQALPLHEFADDCSIVDRLQNERMLAAAEQPK